MPVPAPDPARRSPLTEARRLVAVPHASPRRGRARGVSAFCVAERTPRLRAHPVPPTRARGRADRRRASPRLGRASAAAPPVRAPRRRGAARPHHRRCRLQPRGAAGVPRSARAAHRRRSSQPSPQHGGGAPRAGRRARTSSSTARWSRRAERTRARGAPHRACRPHEIETPARCSDFASVPGAVGMNNHMGSQATADAALMTVVLGYLKRRRQVLRRQPDHR